jgi:methionine-rich copper-binding protein CopC
MRFRLILPLLPLPIAQAHAELVSANPVVGAHLDALPTQVEVTFDGNLLNIGSAKTNVLVVKDPEGLQIDAKDSHVSGAKLIVGLNPITRDGEFTVSWRVVSSDGHPEEGSYQFSVGQVTAIAAPPVSATMAPVTSTPAQYAPTKNFWTRYGTLLLLLLAVAIAVGIWIRFELVRRKLE